MLLEGHDLERQTIFDLLSIKEVLLELKNRIIQSPAGPLVKILAQIARIDVLDTSIKEIATEAIQPSVRAKAFRCIFEGRNTWITGRKWVWTDKRYGEGRLEPIIGERKLVTEWPLFENIQIASQDRSSIVRRVAGEFLIRNRKSLGMDGLTLAKKLAMDSSIAVAEQGRFVLDRAET